MGKHSQLAPQQKLSSPGCFHIQQLLLFVTVSSEEAIQQSCETGPRFFLSQFSYS